MGQSNESITFHHQYKESQILYSESNYAAAMVPRLPGYPRINLYSGSSEYIACSSLRTERQNSTAILEITWKVIPIHHTHTEFTRWLHRTILKKSDEALA